MNQALRTSFLDSIVEGPHRSLARLLLAAVAGVLVALSLARFGWAVCLVAGWDVMSWMEVGMVWLIFIASNPEQTRESSLRAC
jgi:hypothetical protein